MSLTFALIRERKNPPDKRVVMTPQQCVLFKKQFPQAQLLVESSPIRIFDDQSYRALGIEVTDDVSSADIMIGVKEVPKQALIPGKSYLFFSHTIKKQPYNRELLRAILDLKISLFDHETFVSASGSRLIGFGRYAGLVGAYNGFRLFGLRQGLFDLPKVHTLYDLEEVKEALDQISLPQHFKVVLTGKGKVALGAQEILQHLGLEKLDPSDFLNGQSSAPSYAMIDILDYNRKMDGSLGSKSEFYQNPEHYLSDFARFTKVADLFVAGHFYGNGAPIILTREDLAAPDCRIDVVADVSCDIDGPVACTLRPSTIEDPFYGYDAHQHREVSFDQSNSIGVMAVDNLPCELPRDASHGFGQQFLASIAPSFFDGDQDKNLERAMMTNHHGALTQRFSNLKDFAAGKD
jgi:alanine dehydrogenase